MFAKQKNNNKISKTREIVVTFPHDAAAGGEAGEAGEGEAAGTKTCLDTTLILRKSVSKHFLRKSVSKHFLRKSVSKHFLRKSVSNEKTIINIVQNVRMTQKQH